MDEVQDVTEFVIGSEIQGEEGFSTELRQVVVDASGQLLTHLVLEPRHEGGPARIVPLRLVDADGDELRIGCTRAGFEELPKVGATDFVTGPTLGGREPPAAVVMGRSDRVQAEDGTFGRVKGVLVVPGEHEVTHVLVDELRLPRRQRHAVPAEAVDVSGDGIEVGLSKEEIRELPKDPGRPADA